MPHFCGGRRAGKGMVKKMENSNLVVVKKKNTVWTVIKILLAVGAVCLVAAKIYQKFFKNKKASAEEIKAEDETPEIAEAEAVEDDAFEVPAEAVIANAEDME